MRQEKHIIPKSCRLFGQDNAAGKTHYPEKLKPFRIRLCSVKKQIILKSYKIPPNKLAEVTLSFPSASEETTNGKKYSSSLLSFYTRQKHQIIQSPVYFSLPVFVAIAKNRFRLVGKCCKKQPMIVRSHPIFKAAVLCLATGLVAGCVTNRAEVSPALVEQDTTPQSAVDLGTKITAFGYSTALLSPDGMLSALLPQQDMGWKTDKIIFPDMTTTASIAPESLYALPHADEETLRLISYYAQTHALPESLVRRVISRESKGDPAARNGPYYGLMQISYPTAKSMGYKGTPDGLLDAQTNLHYAVKYLAGAYKVADGDEQQAIHFYARGYYYDAKRKGLLEETGLLPIRQSAILQ